MASTTPDSPDPDPPTTDGPLPDYYRRIKEGRGKSGSVTVALGAAMIAVGEILEPDKTTVEIEQPTDDPHRDDESGLDLSFGDLPDLN